MKRMLISSLLLFWFAFLLPAVNIEHLREVTLSQNDETFIQKAGSFIVTGDEMVLVFDYKAGHMKIFDLNGKLVKIFGGKGLGPNEFVRPFFSSYNKPYVVFADFGRKSVFVYKKTGRDTFEFIHRYFCLGMGCDFQLVEAEKLMIAGYKVDNDRKEYHLYQYDFENDKCEFILPSEISYGFESFKRFKHERKETLAYIGLAQFFDYSSNSIYFVWEGDIRIIKINRRTWATVSFGKKTRNYVKPYLTPEIRKAYDQRKDELIFKLVNRMSYVMDIFVLQSGRIGLVYVGPLGKNKGLNVVLQFYEPGGKFIKECEVLNAKGDYHSDLFFYFSKDKNLLYIMDRETSEAFDQFYYVHEYKIIE